MNEATKPLDAPAAAPITETPEFREALERATAETVARVLASLQPSQPAAGGAPVLSGSDKTFAESLAMAFATLSEQGGGRKYVAPDVLRARTEARERMMDLIVEAKNNGEKPLYRLTAKVCLDHQLVEPMYAGADHVAHPTDVYWDLVPNDAMMPLNDVAKAIHAEFLASIGGVEKVIPADKFGLTRGGLVVKNGAIPSAAGERGVANAPEPAHGGGLVVPHMNGPGKYTQKHVLGTIHEPALQAG